MGNSKQLAFTFAAEPSFSEGNFYVSDCNREAQAWVDRWPEWLGYGLILTGPHGSGKTHLAHIWRQKAQALFLPAALLTDDFSPAMIGQAARVIVDDAHTAESPAALFHLLNWLREHGGAILLTGNAPAASWPFALPDLRSRLLALPAAALHAPDDALLLALLTKLFADQQLSVSAAVLEYLVRHMERSFESASRLVARLDALALAHGRSLTLPLARQVMENL